MKRRSIHSVLVVSILYLFSVILLEVAHDHPLLEEGTAHGVSSASSSIQSQHSVHGNGAHLCLACVISLQRCSTVPAAFVPQAPTVALSLTPARQLTYNYPSSQLSLYKRGPPVS